MPLEAKELIEYLGFDASKITDIESFKKEFEPEAGKPVFIRADKVEHSHVYPNIAGKLLGSIQTKVKSIAKKYGVDFDPEELKDKKVEDIFELSAEKIAGSHKAIIDELNEKVGKGNDERVKEWETKYQKLESKYNDTKSLAEKIGSEFEGFKGTAAQQLKNYKLDIVKKDIFGKAKIKQNASELELLGFKTKFAEKYDLDLDENENVFIKDRKTGTRIQSKTKASDFADPVEVINEFVVEIGLHEKNPAGGKTVFNPNTGNQGQFNPDPNKVVSKVGNRLHPSRAAAQ